MTIRSPGTGLGLIKIPDAPNWGDGVQPKPPIIHLNIFAHQELEILPGIELAALHSYSLEERGR